MESLEKRVLVPIANGSEEIEAVCIIDTLRRAGATVTVASVENDLQVTCSRGTKLVADTKITDCESQDYDLVVLPGGMPGAEHLRDSAVLKRILERQRAQRRPYGAICASPAVVLQTYGLLDGIKATCHPSFADKLAIKDAVESRVVKDGVVFTSRAPGTAIEFALSLVEELYGKEKAEQVAKPMLVLRS